VIQVTPTAARVLLAIDPNFSAASRAARTGEIGSISGRGSDPMLLQPLEPGADIQRGDEIVTSSFAGGVFPGGIPIGVVADEGDTTARLTRSITVLPYVDFTRLHHVLVVLSAPVEPVPPLEGTPGIPFEPPPLSPDADDDPLPDPDEPAGTDEPSEGAAPPQDIGSADDGRPRDRPDGRLRLLLVTVAVIETSVLPFLPLPGLTPDLLLLITMVVALKDGPQAGLRVGFAAGLLADLLVAQAPLGSATLVLTSIGGIVGTARPYLASQSVSAPLVLAFSPARSGPPPTARCLSCSARSASRGSSWRPRRCGSGCSTPCWRPSRSSGSDGWSPLPDGLRGR
jgi:hypothetical protein